MANPWDNDPIVQPAPKGVQRQPNPWDNDEIVGDFGGVTTKVDSTERIVDLPPVRAVIAPENQGFDYRNLPYVLRPSQMQDGTLGEFVGQHAADAGRSVRSALRGLGGVLDFVGEPIAAGIDALTAPERTLGDLVTGEEPARTLPQQIRFRELGDMAADAVGLPVPETAGQRVVDDIGQALAGTAATLGVGGALNAGRSAASSPTLANRVGDVLGSQPALQTISAATGAGAAGTTREAGGGTGAQVLAGVLGGLAPGGVAAGIPATIRGGLRGGETNRAALERTLGDFDVVGATPSVGQGTGSWARQGLESLLTGAPTSGGVMRRFAERQADQIGEGLQARAEDLYRNASSERAGRAIEQGIRGEEGFLARTRAMSDRLYSRLDESIPGDERVEIGNTRQALADLNASIEGAPSVSRFFQNARLQGIEGALAQDAGGIEGVLSRPGMRERVDQMRAELEGQAATRRAELAQETNVQRQDLTAEAGQRREALMAEQDALRERMAGMVESRREQLYREADELQLELRAQQQAAIAENRRRAMFPETRNSLLPVLSDADIARQVPTRASIDSRLPTAADIEAQMLSRADIEAQVMSPQEINQRVTPDSAINDANFGKDYIDQQINSYLESQVDQRLPYEALQKLRTLVGNELEGSSLMSDVPRSKWKAVYGALTRDMEAAATTPEAKRALDRANAYFRARVERMDAIDRVIDRNGGPEKIYQAVMSGTKDGGTTLRAVMQSLPQEGQKAVTAAVIKRMGLATPGAQDAAGEAFSAATFLTNWNRVSPEARRALFDRHGPSFTRDMDKIAKVAQSIKEGSEVFRNPSGTANRGTAMTYGASLAGAILTGQTGIATTLAGTGVGANLLARLMTNAKWVRWLSKATEMPVGALPAQVNVLNRIAKENDDPEIAEAASALEQTLQNEVDQTNKASEEQEQRQGD